MAKSLSPEGIILIGELYWLKLPPTGIGKPKPLKGNLFGFWSRRINEHNRLMYRIQGTQGEVCEVAQCKEYYDV